MKTRLAGLPLRLVTLLVIPLIALLTVIAFSGVALHQQAMQNLIVEHNLATVNSVVTSLDQKLTQQSSYLVSIGGAYRQMGAAAFQRLDDVDEIFDRGIIVLTGEDEQVVHHQSTLDPGWVLASVQNQDDDALPIIMLPLLADDPPELVLAIVYREPDQPGDNALAVIGLTSQSQLSIPTLLDSLHLTSHSSNVFLLDRSGRIMYHTDPERIGEFAPDTPYVQQALRGETAAGRFTGPEGADVIATFIPAGSSGLFLVQEEYWQDIVSPLMRLSQAAPLVLVPGLLIALAVMWFGISQIVQPLQQLEARSSDLAWGNFDSINQPLRGIDEIRQLQKTLQFMAGRIQTTQSGMRHYIAAMTRGQEEERVRLARELHDGMIQSLIALGHREQILRRYLRDDPGGQEVLNEVRSMTTGAVDDLRRIIRAMRPIYLEELGLTPALEMLAKDLKADSEIEVHFSHEGLDRRLESEQELALFRVAQEALNNVKQHSHADSGWLAIHFDTGTVMITVRDNGDGFQAPERITELSEAGHFGLMGMAERAQLVGARLQIESLPGRGTTVTLSFEIPADS